MGIEKRRHPRVDVKWPVSFYVEHDYPERIVNISIGGAFIETPKAADADSIITLRFSLSDGSGLIEARAKVMWATETSLDAEGNVVAGGMGVMFVELSPEVRKQLEGFIEANAGSGGD